MTTTPVTEWQHRHFDTPTPLVRRDEVRPGDTIASSHGFLIYVTKVTVYDPLDGVAAIFGQLHQKGGAPWTERYVRHSTVPLVDRRTGDWECFSCGALHEALTEGFGTKCDFCGSYELHLSDAVKARFR